MLEFTAETLMSSYDVADVLSVLTELCQLLLIVVNRRIVRCGNTLSM